MPDWVQALFKAIASTIEFKGFAYMEGRYWAPDEMTWDIDLLEMAPALMEIAQPGPDEGTQGYGIMHNFDLLAAQEAFDEVVALAFGFENDGRPCLTIEGMVNGREIVVLVYTDPFEDAEVETIIE